MFYGEPLRSGDELRARPDADIRVPDRHAFEIVVVRGLHVEQVEVAIAIESDVAVSGSLDRDRLFGRVKTILSEHDVKIDRNDLIREVSIYAERSDIAEEVVRLATHLEHFQEILKEEESPGRKLEFLTQEMFRETNTIGLKGPSTTSEPIPSGGIAGSPVSPPVRSRASVLGIGIPAAA